MTLYAQYNAHVLVSNQVFVACMHVMKSFRGNFDEKLAFVVEFH